MAAVMRPSSAGRPSRTKWRLFVTVPLVIVALVIACGDATACRPLSKSIGRKGPSMTSKRTALLPPLSCTRYWRSGRVLPSAALVVVFLTVGWPGSMTLMPLAGSVVGNHQLGGSARAVITAVGGVSALAVLAGAAATAKLMVMRVRARARSGRTTIAPTSVGRPGLFANARCTGD